MNILLAEDNPNDVAIFRAAVARRADRENVQLDCVDTGSGVLNRLYGSGSAGQTIPDLIVLNINMPTNGWDVLGYLKANPRFRAIPVVMWSIAEIDAYYRRAYEWGACGYFTKPIAQTDMEKQINAIIDFFLQAQLPRRTPS